MNICFIMDPWENIDPETDSTIRLIHEGVKRKHNIGIVYPHNLTIRDTVVNATCRMVVKTNTLPSNISSFYKKIQFKKQMLPLRGFDVIFVRDDPPIDNFMLNVLDSVKGDSFIINDVDGLRKANNKIYTAALDEENKHFIPVTHVSKNKEYLKHAVSESATDKMILKPLDGFGGSGVIVLEKEAKQNINSLLDFYIDKKGKNNYVIMQEFIESEKKGDVRILMLNGQPIGAMRRVPADDDMRSNVHAGGSVEKHTLSKQEKLLCKNIGPKLVSDGLYFVGLDLIGEKLIEVNVCSPGGIVRINKLNRTKLQEKILDFAEEVTRKKDLITTRKMEFRKAVSDA